MINKEIGQNIKRYRKERKMTQQKLGELIGKSASSVQKYENGITDISIDTLIRIGQVLEVKNIDLVGSDYEMFGMELNAYAKIINHEDSLFSDGVLISDENLLRYFHLLNIDGKREAILRVQELQYIPKYKGPSGDSPFEP